MKKLIFTLVCAVFFGQFKLARAQVGLNNPNPDPSSILDLKSTDKGLLIPRMSTGERNAMAIGTPMPAKGLLVFDTSLDRIYFWDGTKWRAANVVVADSTGTNEVLRVGTRMSIGSGYTTSQPASNSLLVEGAIGIGTNNLGSDKLSVDGTTKLNGNTRIVGTLHANDYTLPSGSGNGPVPKGVIVMWSGSLSNIPTGWAICDGNNGTPNLQNRFIVGAGIDYSVNDSGGAKEVTLTDAQTPLKSHSHGVNLTTSSDGQHQHDIQFDDDKGGKNYQAQESADCCGKSGTYKTEPAGSHSHTVTGNTNSASNNSAAAHENRPPYYALAYIMKL
jgi:microcystin-dependent protein